MQSSETTKVSLAVALDTKRHHFDKYVRGQCYRVSSTSLRQLPHCDVSNPSMECILHNILVCRDGNSSLLHRVIMLALVMNIIRSV